jgi:hypothetical protein
MPSTPLVTIHGNRLDIQASVDLVGLKSLQEMLQKFEGILQMMEFGRICRCWQHSLQPTPYTSHDG